jgi:DNA-binding response OmpR family regulator
VSAKPQAATAEEYRMSFTMMGNNRRTILLVDPDAHYRAGLRLVLEEAGFLVGEAVNGKEGERTLNRIRPDAVLADLMLETVDPGGSVAAKLREIGSRIPIYIISSTAASIHSDMNFTALGIAGIFAKPADPKVVVQTLKARLKMV